MGLDRPRGCLRGWIEARFGLRRAGERAGEGGPGRSGEWGPAAMGHGFCRMSASLQSKQAIVLSACQLSSNGSILLRAVNFFQFSNFCTLFQRLF